jgi:hypothetical protein
MPPLGNVFFEMHEHAQCRIYPAPDVQIPCAESTPEVTAPWQTMLRAMMAYPIVLKPSSDMVTEWYELNAYIIFKRLVAMHTGVDGVDGRHRAPSSED